MIIEKSKDEFLIRVSKRTVGIREIQDILNFIRFKELTSTFKVKQSSVDSLANSINAKWWSKNKKRILNEIGR